LGSIYNLRTVQFKYLSITIMDTHLIVLSSAAERICWSLLHHRAFFMAEVWPAISWGSALQMPYSLMRYFI